MFIGACFKLEISHVNSKLSNEGKILIKGMILQRFGNMIHIETLPARTGFRVPLMNNLFLEIHFHISVF